MKMTISAIGIVALLVLTSCSPRGSAMKTFENFADAWADFQTEQALWHVRGILAEKAVREKTAERVVPVTMQTIMGIEYTVISKEPSPDGKSLDLRVEQEIRFNPPDVMSAMRATMFARVRHDVTLLKTDDGWKVVAFKPVCLKVGELGAP